MCHGISLVFRVAWYQPCVSCKGNVCHGISLVFRVPWYQPCVSCDMVSASCFVLYTYITRRLKTRQRSPLRRVTSFKLKFRTTTGEESKA